MNGDKPSKHEKRLRRLEFLAKLFRDNNFPGIADEIASLRDEEVNDFYNVMKIWILG